MTVMTDSALDDLLQWFIDNCTRQDICSQEPANYTEATDTHSLGNATGLTVGAQQNGDASGRKSTVPAVTGGSVTGTGTATHIALTKPTATTELGLAKALSASQAVTSGNTWASSAYDVEVADAT